MMPPKPLYAIAQIWLFATSGAEGESQALQTQVARTVEQSNAPSHDLDALCVSFGADIAKVVRISGVAPKELSVGVQRDLKELARFDREAKLAQLGLRLARLDVQALKELRELSEYSHEGEPVDCMDLVQSALDLMDFPPAMYPFGLRSLDEILGGAQTGIVTLIGAGTGVGKSAFFAAAIGNALEKKFPVGLVSLEDHPNNLLLRLAARAANCSLLELLQKDKINHFQAERAAGKLEELARCHFLAFGPTQLPSKGVGPEELHAAVLALVHKDKKLIYIDHLTEVQQKPGENIWNVTARTMTLLRDVAIRHGVAIVAAAQLKLGEETPGTGSFAGGSELIRKARAAITLYRKEKPDFVGAIYAKVIKSTRGRSGEELALEMANGGVLKESSVPHA